MRPIPDGDRDWKTAGGGLRSQKTYRLNEAILHSGGIEPSEVSASTMGADAMF